MPKIVKGPQVPIGPHAVPNKAVVEAVRGRNQPITIIVRKRGKSTLNLSQVKTRKRSSS